MLRDKYELNLVLEDYLKRVNDLKECLNVDNLKKEIGLLEEKINEANFWDDNREASKILKKIGNDKNNIQRLEKLQNLVSDYKDLLEMDEDEEVNLMIEALINEVNVLLEKMELDILLSCPFDDTNAIVEIHPGAGGVEAHDWADMLYRMYIRYCDNNDFKVEIIDHLSGEEAGIKSVTFGIKGLYAYGYLKSEKGVHRLVRISPFDANKRRHTSFAALDVMPEIEDNVEIQIRPEDIQMDTYRASGAGGQHVNKTDSAVRLKHIPTGIVVSCQTERSQIQNKETCMKMLRAKLYQYELNKTQEKLKEIKGELGENGWGNQIRSYVFCPYTMVKDHRTNYEVGNVQAVMNGEIDEFIAEYLKFNANKL